MLSEVHFRHQMLDPGTTQRIEPGESTVRTFPRISANPQEPKIASDTESLTIIPSCHVVGHRRRIWGWPTILGGGPIPTVAQLTPPPPPPRAPTKKTGNLGSTAPRVHIPLPTRAGSNPSIGPSQASQPHLEDGAIYRPCLIPS